MMMISTVYPTTLVPHTTIYDNKDVIHTPDHTLGAYLACGLELSDATENILESSGNSMSAASGCPTDRSTVDECASQPNQLTGVTIQKLVWIDWRGA